MVAIILDFSKTPFIDLSAARAVATIARDARDAERTVYISGMNQDVAAMLSGLAADQFIAADARFEFRIDALHSAIALLHAPDDKKSASRGD